MVRQFASAVNKLLEPLGVGIHRLSTSDAFARQQRIAGHVRTVFDVGAHHGQSYARYRSAFPTAEIHCFEPFPEAFAVLSRRAAGDPHARLNPIALSRDETPRALHVNARSDTNSVLELDDRASTHWAEPGLRARGTIQVPCTTIDSYCETCGLDRIDILKVDVQGFELDVLRGARRMLDSHRIGLVYTEAILAPTYAGQPSFGSYLSLMESFGYELFDICDPIRNSIRLLQTDVIFVPSSPEHGP